MDVNADTEAQAKETLYARIKPPSWSSPHLSVGDYVRVSKYKGYFEKGYLPNWSREIFCVKRILSTQPVTYVLEDQNEEVIKGSFYEEELQRVSGRPEVYKVEKILKKRKRAGREQYLVKWLDYPDNFNSWINASDIVT